MRLKPTNMSKIIDKLKHIQVKMSDTFSRKYMSRKVREIDVV